VRPDEAFRYGVADVGAANPRNYGPIGGGDSGLAQVNEVVRSIDLDRL
jgi:hypothetical protein